MIGIPVLCNIFEGFSRHGTGVVDMETAGLADLPFLEITLSHLLCPFKDAKFSFPWMIFVGTLREKAITCANVDYG